MFKIKNWELCVFTLLTVFIIRKDDANRLEKINYTEFEAH